MRTTGFSLFLPFLLAACGQPPPESSRQTPAVAVLCTIFDIPMDQLEGILKNHSVKPVGDSPFSWAILQNEVLQPIMPKPTDGGRFLDGMRIPNDTWPSGTLNSTYSDTYDGSIRTGGINGLVGTDLTATGFQFHLEASLATILVPGTEGLKGMLRYDGPLAPSESLLFFSKYLNHGYHAVAIRLERETGKPRTVIQGRTGGYGYELAAYGKHPRTHRSNGGTVVNLGETHLKIKDSIVHVNGRQGGKVEKGDFIQVDVDGGLAVNGDSRELVKNR